MLIKNPVFEPLILTIPDDVIVFSIFSYENAYSRKFIMENYINFYSVNPPHLQEVVFRFENFMDYESIHGLERCFIPMGIVKKYYSDEAIILQLLKEGYIVNMPVDRSCISFYGKEAVGTHRILIFGANLDKKIFICKDFKGHGFVEFKIGFSDLINSTNKFDNPNSREANGILAFRIDRTVSGSIEYAKVLSEFKKLGQDVYDLHSGYGIGAISLFMQDALERKWDSILCYKFYEVSNYMREASKLMINRYDIMLDIFGDKKIDKMEELRFVLRELEANTNKLFFKVCRLEFRKAFSGIEVKPLIILMNDCKESFKKVSGSFCNVINILM